MAIIEYEDKIHKIVNENDHRNFIFDFLSVYEKIARSTITKLRKGSNNLSKNPDEVYLKNKLYFKKVNTSLLESYNALSNYVNKLKSKPRFIMVTDYNKLIAKDTKTEDTLDIEFKQLPKYFEFFLPWNGIEKVDFDKENPADIKAAERFARLFDVIIKDNEGIKDDDNSRHGLNLFLVRLLFCLFAEDTGIFKKDLFTNTLKSMTSDDGHDFNDITSKLFEFLDKKDRTSNEAGWLRGFPYVDGQMFIEKQIPLHFTDSSRNAIIEAGESIRWENVNPDILGSMLQAVASEDSRKHLGMHYTSVPNIMKVIKPLFLDNLNKTFEDAKGDSKKLNALLTRMSKIRFMDPACGSGNFLIITYKELRKLEIKILHELRTLDPGTFYVPSIGLGQFYGIEIDDFACDVTRLSLWIADHQMNQELAKNYVDVVRPTLPLSRSGEIKCGNALRIDWKSILPHKNNDEIYLFGNPPYLGARKQNSKQKDDLLRAIGNIKNLKSLDYISGWFIKGIRYITGSIAKYAFVTTNSISEGEQVSALWPEIFKRYGTITFAYQSFKWGNNAKHNAGVTVNIIGIADKQYFNDDKVLYFLNNEKKVNNISPYLTSGNNIIVFKTNDKLNNLPTMNFGSMPNDDSNFIIKEDEYYNLTSYDKKFYKVLLGGNEFLNNKIRYCLWLYNVDSSEYDNSSYIKDIIIKVKNYRLSSKRPATQKLASRPQLFGEIRWKQSQAIIIPCSSSENRLYVPMGIVDSNTIISNSAMSIYGAPIWVLGLLQSRIHMVWLKNIGGKLETRYRYSASLVYNTFPIPELSSRRKNEIEELTLNILAIREEEKGSLAELYGSPLAKKNPKSMNERLLKAHQELDKVVDRAYKSSDFKNDNERLELLLKMYSNMKDGDNR